MLPKTTCTRYAKPNQQKRSWFRYGLGTPTPSCRAYHRRMRIYTDTVTTSANAATTGAVRTPFVSLLSDFGSRDPSAGIMRAVVTGICPEANVVDISHEEISSSSSHAGEVVEITSDQLCPKGAALE